MGCFVGIDLAAFVHRPTGLAALCNGKVETKLVHTEKEILDFITSHKPNLIAIDAPLTAPLKGKNRQAEQILLAMGIRTFPIKGLKSMEFLYKRAQRLTRELNKLGYKFIETFPSPLREKFILKSKNPHIRDAIICANVAKLHFVGKTIGYGDKKEGLIFLPTF
ncbi:MAG: DUF429 domain-containing protein [Candidatus Nanoarchaeia archaeon]